MLLPANISEAQVVQFECSLPATEHYILTYDTNSGRDNLKASLFDTI